MISTEVFLSSTKVTSILHPAIFVLSICSLVKLRTVCHVYSQLNSRISDQVLFIPPHHWPKDCSTWSLILPPTSVPLRETPPIYRSMHISASCWWVTLLDSPTFWLTEKCCLSYCPVHFPLQLHGCPFITKDLTSRLLFCSACRNSMGVICINIYIILAGDRGGLSPACPSFPQWKVIYNTKFSPC